LTELDSVPGGIGLTGFLNRLYGGDTDPAVLGHGGAMEENFHQSLATLRPAVRNPLIAILVSEEAATYRPEMRWLAEQQQRHGRRVFGVDIPAVGVPPYADARIYGEHGVPVVGVPKTIDNDLGATDYTFGFDTAVNIAMEAIDRLHTTADSHHRVLIVEVMGRHAGWIAFHAGLAGGANVILIPELPFDLEKVCEFVGRRYESNYAPILVVAEGAQPVGGMPAAKDEKLDQFGHVHLGGIAHWLEGEIERKTGKETRATVLGHVQRGGTPTAFDRVLATRFGLHAIDAVDAGEWGKMTALRGTDIQLVDLSEATAELKTVPESLYSEAEVFFG